MAILQVLTVLAVAVVGLAPAAQYELVVGGYNSELSNALLIESTEGSLASGQQQLVDIPNLTWIEVDGDNLYAVHELDEYEGQESGAISRWRLADDGMTYVRQEVS